MCVNKRWITNKYNGQRLYVSCGHCPACLQQKADARAKRIKANYPDTNDGTIAIMFTLSYANKFVPYILPQDIDEWRKFRDAEISRGLIKDSFFGYKGLKEDELCFSHDSLRLDIYRDYSCRLVRGKKRYRHNEEKPLFAFTSKGIKYVYKFTRRWFGNAVIDELKTLDYGCANPYSLPPLQNDVEGILPSRIGVCYYPDFQLFIKRLRQNLKRKYGIYDKFSYYSCSEYGGKSSRPHFHVLLFTKAELYSVFKRAINESWPYDYCNAERKCIQIAINAASYVASYVNCSNVVPEIFQNSKVRQKHSYSQGFGMARESYSLDSVYKSFLRHDFTENRQVLVGHTLFDVVSVIPAYVLGRYAPKFKGYSRLTTDELFDIYYNPFQLNKYARWCEMDNEQLRAAKVAIQNKMRIWLNAGYDRYTFALFCSRCWSVRSSNTLRISLEKVDNWWYHYYNILDYYSGDVSSLSLDDWMFSMPPDLDIIVNPCEFPEDSNIHNYYYAKYFLYSKKKEIIDVVTCDKYAYN